MKAIATTISAALALSACSQSGQRADTMPAKSWEFAGMDDDTDRYPTQIFCTQSDDFNVMSNEGKGARLCVDYVPGLKRIALPKISYFGRPEKDELALVGDKGTITAKLLRSGHVDNVTWRPPMWDVYVREPGDKSMLKFLRAQRSIRINGAVLNVTGGPWEKPAAAK